MTEPVEMKSVMCLLLGGPDRCIVDRNGKTWWLEDHPRMGPCPLTPKTREPMSRPPVSERNPFWECIQLWIDQGKRRVGALCVWQFAPEPILMHISGRHYQQIGEWDRANEPESARPNVD